MPSFYSYLQLNRKKKEDLFGNRYIEKLIRLSKRGDAVPPSCTQNPTFERKHLTE